MKNNYWMKLWFDILSDPKMGMLPDRLWRRVIELFLVAGKQGDDGELPDLETMAWTLKLSKPALEKDLERIAELGIVTKTDGGWVVTNFKKRNEPVDPMKRIKDFRKRERYEKGNENETEMKRECNAAVTMRYQEAEEQKNRATEEQNKEAAAAISGTSAVDLAVKAYEKHVGVLSPGLFKLVETAVAEYPEGWVEDAIREAAGNNARSWNYIAKILGRWKVEGRAPKNGHKQPGADVDLFRKLYREQKRGADVKSA